MEQFMYESELRFSSGRTHNRGNWVSARWNGFEVKLSDEDFRGYSQIELKKMCIKCLNTLFG